jgi:hypothetical protein
MQQRLCEGEWVDLLRNTLWHFHMLKGSLTNAGRCDGDFFPVEIARLMLIERVSLDTPFH